jgi:hypothetical protein
MPITRKYRRKKNKKKAKRRPRKLVRYNYPVGMPLKHTCKLRYTDVISLDAGAGAMASHAFRMNNIFDCDASGTGHQPRHYDLLAEVYNYYTVRGAKITAKIVGFDESSAERTQAFGIRIGNQTILTAPNTDVAALHEAGRTLNTKWTMVRHEDPTKTRTLTHTWSLRKTKANSNESTDDVLTGTTSGAGPARQDYAVVFVGTELLDPAQNGCRLQVLVSIDYVVQFRGVKGNLPED